VVATQTNSTPATLDTDESGDWRARSRSTSDQRTEIGVFRAQSRSLSAYIFEGREYRLSCRLTCQNVESSRNIRIASYPEKNLLFQLINSVAKQENEQVKKYIITHYESRVCDIVICPRFNRYLLKTLNLSMLLAQIENEKKKFIPPARCDHRIFTL
jgi:hypothetical protein